MELTRISEGAAALLREDGSAVAVQQVTDALVSAVKQHGHYGNIAHHIAAGDWEAFATALARLLFSRHAYEDLDALAQNLARLLGGEGPANIRPFRTWFLDRLEAESSALHRQLVERRIDALNEAGASALPRFRKSAIRILTRG
jgi:hypothetical protein